MSAFIIFYFYFIIANTIITEYYSSVIFLILAYLGALYYFYKYYKNDVKIQFNLTLFHFLALTCCIIYLANNIFFINRYLLDILPLAIKVSLNIINGLILLFILSLLIRIPKFSKINIYAIATLVFIFNVILIYYGGIPRMDVYNFFKEGAETILSFNNPYLHNYPQIYPPHQIKIYYYNDPRFLHSVPMNPYAPVGLWIATIGHLIGDVRIVAAIELLITPFLIKGICRLQLPTAEENNINLLAVLPLIYPTQTQLLYYAYNDLSVAFFLVLFTYLYLNNYLKLSYIALAITFALKQYTLIYFLPFLFILNIKDLRLWLTMALIVALPVLIYVTWDIKSFADSVILLQMKLPFRADSKSLASLLNNLYEIKLYTPIIYIPILSLSTIISLIVALKLKTSRLSDAAAKLKFVLFSGLFLFFNFLMFSKQSFGNYYYFLGTIFYMCLLFSFTDNISNDSRNLVNV